MPESVDNIWKGIAGSAVVEIRTQINVIKGYAQILKIYVDQLKQEGITPAIIAAPNVTVEDAANEILNATEHLELFASQMRDAFRKSQDEIEGRNNDTE